MLGWHHWLDGHEFEWAAGVGDGQGGLACCSPWCHRVRQDWQLSWSVEHCVIFAVSVCTRVFRYLFFFTPTLLTLSLFPLPQRVFVLQFSYLCFPVISGHFSSSVIHWALLDSVWQWKYSFLEKIVFIYIWPCSLCCAGFSMVSASPVAVHRLRLLWSTGSRARGLQ